MEFKVTPHFRCMVCGHDSEMHVRRDEEGMPDLEPCRVRVVAPDAPEGFVLCGCTVIDRAG